MVASQITKRVLQEVERSKAKEKEVSPQASPNRVYSPPNRKISEREQPLVG